MDAIEPDIESYVRAALALQGYALEDDQVRAVALQFSRIAALYGAVLREPVPPLTEPLPVFRP